MNLVDQTLLHAIRTAAPEMHLEGGGGAVGVTFLDGFPDVAVDGEVLQVVGYADGDAAGGAVQDAVGAGGVGFYCCAAHCAFPSFRSRSRVGLLAGKIVVCRSR